MPLLKIPEAWRRDVCALLKTEATGKLIEWEPLGRTRYEADYHPRWPYEVYAAFRVFLESGQPHGCSVAMKTPGETWEFIFIFEGKPAYGKILHTRDRKRILIFSAHRPLKANLSCE